MDRYILREFFHALIYCIVAFISLYIIADLFNYIDEMIRNHLTVRTVFIYYATFIPTIFVQIAPMAALLATIYTLSNFKKYNEITAMRVSGVSLWRITKPILFASALLSIAVFVVNEKVVPEFMPISAKIREVKIREIGKKDKKTVIKNVAIFADGNRIIYARQFDIDKNELEDIIVHQNDEHQNLIMKLSAEKGHWVGERWIFENGTSYKLDRSGYITGPPSRFRKKIMEIEERPKDFIRKNKRIEFMSYKQLKSYIDKFSAETSATKTKLLVDLYYKTSLPFICLVIIFIATPFAFMVQRGGVLIGIGMSILIGFIFYSVHAVSLAMGKAGILPPLFSAWFSNVFFFVAGLYFMKKCR